MIGLLLVGCSVSLGQPINMVFMLMDDVSLTRRGEEGGRRKKGREKEKVRGYVEKGEGRKVAERVVLH